MTHKRIAYMRAEGFKVRWWQEVDWLAVVGWTACVTVAVAFWWVVFEAMKWWLA